MPSELLVLNDRSFTADALHQYAAAQLQDETLSQHDRELFLFLQEWLSESKHISVRTSGSTGIPKVISHTKASMINSARMTGDYFGIKGDESLLLCLPVSFIAGKMMVVRAMVWGTRLVTLQPSSNPLITLPNRTINFAALTPMQAFNALQHGETREKLAQIDTVILGGGPVSATLEEMLQELPNKVYHTYGMTETTTHVAMRRLNGPERTDHFEALDGVAFRTDERGCLQITAPHLFEGMITTNDVVRLESSTSFLWQGRFDNIINSGGLKLFPEQLEEKLNKVLDASFAFCSETDEALGERLVLCIEGELAMDPTQLDSLLEATFHAHERPKRLVIIPKLPRTANGKLDRKVLKEHISTV